MRGIDLKMWVGFSLLLGLAIGCGKQPRTLLVFDALPTTLNPLYATADQDFRAHELIYERMFYRPPNVSRAKSDIVRQYAYQANLKNTTTPAELVLTVREDRRWANGKPVLPEDLCFTIQALLNPENRVSWATGHREILSGCTVTGDTVVVGFKRRVQNPIEWLMIPLLPAHRFDSTTVSPEHPAAVQAYGIRNLKASLKPDQVVFESVKKKEAPNIKRVVIQAPQDQDWTLEQLEIGNAQGMVSLSPDFWSRAEEDITVSTVPFDEQAWWFIAMNTNQGPGVDPLFRKALDHLLVRTQVLNRINRGPVCGAAATDTACMREDAATPTTRLISGPFPRSSPYYNEAVPVVDATMDLGDTDLETLGYTRASQWMKNDVPVTLRVGISGEDHLRQPKLLSAIAQVLQEAGFTLTTEVVPGPWPGRDEATAGRFDLFIGRWHTQNPGGQIHPLFSSHGALNLFGHQDPKLDALFAERFSSAPSRTTSTQWMYAVHAHLAETRPVLFLWSTEQRSVWRKEFRGTLKPNPKYYYTDFMNWAWLRPWL